jgi:hypothetical protein
MEQVRTTLEKRKHSRLWAPKGLRAIKKFLTERDHEDAAAFGEDSAPEKTETEINEVSYREYTCLILNYVLNIHGHKDAILTVGHLQMCPKRS